MTVRPTARVRPARSADIPALTEIAHAAKRHWGYPDEWMAHWRGELTITPAQLVRDHVFVATEGANLIGFYALREMDPGWSLEHCWVRPAWIGRGIGRLLFDHCVSEIRRGRPGTLRIESDPHAAGFYRRMGAVPIGKVDASLDGPVRALPVLVLDIASSP